MSERIRTLNDNGTEIFKQYVINARAGLNVDPPEYLLRDDSFSSTFSEDVEVSQCVFENRFELGQYLVERLQSLDRYQISRNHGLWNWLALYFFDTICKKDGNGARKILREEVYVVDAIYNYLRYYKHLVRTPWLAVLDHGDSAKVLFVNSKSGTRSDIEETISASQQVFGNRTVIEAVSLLYFNPTSGKPKPGAAGKGAGSPRRLTSFVQQISLTYDIESCSSKQFVAMLPTEFGRFKS